MPNRRRSSRCSLPHRSRPIQLRELPHDPHNSDDDSQGVTMSDPTNGPVRRQERGLTRAVRACAVHPWRTIAAWALIVVTIVTASATFGGKLVNESSIPGSDSQQAVDLLQDRFPA